MDAKPSKPRCWEITGCDRRDKCKVLDLAKASGKSCWEVVDAFDDYRSALNVCGDCVVAVISRQHALSRAEIVEIMEAHAENSSSHNCPGMQIS